jgi:anthranilate synthase component 1
MNESYISATYEQFCERSKQARLVPIAGRFISDLDTPLTLFSKIHQNREHVFLFESMEGGEKWGRYSFIGFDPLVTFVSTDNTITITTIQDDHQEIENITGNPILYLRKLVDDMNAYEDHDLPRFCGGLVGFLGYEMVRFMEELPDSHEGLDLPDTSFMIPGTVLVHDSFEQTVTIVHWVDSHSQVTSEEMYGQAVSHIDNVFKLLGRPVPEEFSRQDGKGGQTKSEFKANMEPSEFHEMVKKAKEYILAGDIFQVVLSQRFHTKTKVSPFSIYRALRYINPSPYLFFLKFKDLVQIGSSPEILVRKEGSSIELRPIAGTRPRGKTVEEDRALEEDLLADPKERAEHLMLVDLGRNDVGRVAKGGSVEVGDLLVVERYSHVMHIVSGVHGIIDEGYDQFDVVNACFPAGTVSGAPKIRAMEIIDELEPERRGPYAGSVGYFGFSGNMDLCITIRTFVMQGDDLWVQAGAGIVADSDPHKEFEETVNKSMGLRRALELAEMRFSS